MFVIHGKVALVKCSLNLFSHLISCHRRRKIKVSFTALHLHWVLVLESCETGGRALAVQSQWASEHFISNHTSPRRPKRKKQMLDPCPRHRLSTAHPSSRPAGHTHLFEVEIWNQASTLGEVPSPKLTS